MFVRSNKDSFVKFYSEAYQIAEELNDSIRTVNSFLSYAPTMIPNTDYEVEHNEIDYSNGKTNTWTEVVERWKKEKNVFRSFCSDLSKCTPLAVAVDKIKKVAETLENIYKLILHFEEDALQNVFLKEEFANKENISVELVNGVEVVYYELDGEKLTIAELTNAFYTYTGMSMDTMIQRGIQFNDFGANLASQMKILDDVNSFVGNATRASAFGVASREDILNTARDLGVSTDLSSVESILASSPNNDVNSHLTTSSAVAGFALLGAYFVTNGLSTEKEEEKQKPSRNPTSSPSLEQRPNGGNNVVPSNPLGEESVKVETLVETLPSIEVITNEEIPETIQFDDEIDYDEMAIEEFEALDFDEVTERTNQVIEEALTLFESEDKTALKEKLASFGYSEPEINEMIDNREYVVTAIIEGDRRQQLGEIANRLADQDGIKDFDTSYDDGQQYEDLTDGTSSEFIIDMGNDPTVSEKRTIYWKDRNTYQEKLQEANDSINAARVAKSELNSIQREIGSDQSKWTTEQAIRYNSAVTKYNAAVYESNKKVDIVKNAKETYNTSKNDYMSSKENYLKMVRGEKKEDDSFINRDDGHDITQADKVELSDADVLNSMLSNNE